MRRLDARYLGHARDYTIARWREGWDIFAGRNVSRVAPTVLHARRASARMLDSRARWHIESRAHIGARGPINIAAETQGADMPHARTDRHQQSLESLTRRHVLMTGLGLAALPLASCAAAAAPALPARASATSTVRAYGVKSAAPGVAHLQIQRRAPGAGDVVLDVIGGVGCMVDSCGDCVNCLANREQNCVNGATFTYNTPDLISGGTTYGGYS